MGKVDFAIGALCGPDPFERVKRVHPDVHCALARAAGFSSDELMNLREKATRDIERRVEAARDSGRTERWFGNSDESIRVVCCDVSRKILEELACATHFEESEAPYLFRGGGPL